MTFRSGNDGAADQFFSEGVANFDNKRLEVITPYSGHRNKTNKAYQDYSLDRVDLASHSDIIYQSKSNKKTESLIDQYVSGEKNHYTIKAAYIIRDTVKVLGTNHIKPATIGIFYDDLAKPKSGETGLTMQVCKKNKVPFITQTTWFNWL